LVGCRAPLGELTGNLRHDLRGIARPAVGDWVAVADSDDRAIIHHLLDRRTALIRRAAGPSAQPQTIAANVDRFGIVTSANRDFNLRRLERYLAVVWESGATPIVVLNKVDLIDDATPLLAEIESVAFGVPIVGVSAATGEGLDALREHFGPGTTVAFVGSSGVGKSSLVNRLLGRVAQEVKSIRDDDARGRHTTTRRELIAMPSGSVLIDTPGMRELGLIEDSGGIDAAFADITELAETCRFTDCQHETEPGCAVREALDTGVLSLERWESYGKLQREIAAYEARHNPLLAAERRRHWKVIHKSVRTQAKITRKP
jgi:ribosome biogenesis GTPase